MENAFFLDFSSNFGRFYRDLLRKTWLERYTQLFFMRVCIYLKQSVRKIGEQNGKYFKGISKIKKKKNIWIERVLTIFRKKLGKIPDHKVKISDDDQYFCLCANHETYDYYFVCRMTGQNNFPSCCTTKNKLSSP